MVLLQLLVIAQGALAQLAQSASVPASPAASSAASPSPSVIPSASLLVSTGAAPSPTPSSTDAGAEDTPNSFFVGCLNEAYMPKEGQVGKVGEAVDAKACSVFCSEYPVVSSWFNPVSGVCTCGVGGVEGNPARHPGDPFTGCDGGDEVYLQTSKEWTFEGCWALGTWGAGTFNPVDTLLTTFACDAPHMVLVGSSYSCFTSPLGVADPVHCDGSAKYVWARKGEPSFNWAPDGSPSASVSASATASPSVSAPSSPSASASVSSSASASASPSASASSSASPTQSSPPSSTPTGWTEYAATRYFIGCLYDQQVFFLPSTTWGNVSNVLECEEYCYQQPPESKMVSLYEASKGKCTCYGDSSSSGFMPRYEGDPLVGCGEESEVYGHRYGWTFQGCYNQVNSEAANFTTLPPPKNLLDVFRECPDSPYMVQMKNAAGAMYAHACYDDMPVVTAPVHCGPDSKWIYAKVSRPPVVPAWLPDGAPSSSASASPTASPSASTSPSASASPSSSPSASASSSASPTQSSSAPPAPTNSVDYANLRYFVGCLNATKSAFFPSRTWGNVSSSILCEDYCYGFEGRGGSWWTLYNAATGKCECPSSTGMPVVDRFPGDPLVGCGEANLVYGHQWGWAFQGCYGGLSTPAAEFNLEPKWFTDGYTACGTPYMVQKLNAENNMYAYACLDDMPVVTDPVHCSADAAWVYAKSDKPPVVPPWLPDQSPSSSASPTPSASASSSASPTPRPTSGSGQCRRKVKRGLQ